MDKTSTIIYEKKVKNMKYLKDGTILKWRRNSFSDTISSWRTFL